jgi:hypothetical protein
MNDCPNAVIRDQLPDLLHERLDPSARAAVLAHVETCADCRAELDVLRGVHGMLVAQTPRVDVRSIVAALPKPAVVGRPVVERQVPESKVVALQPTARRRVWSDWRVAAAVVLFVAGGSSMVLLRQRPVVPPPDFRIDVALPPVAAPARVGSSGAPGAVNSNSTPSIRTPRPPTPAETVASVGNEPGREIGVAGHLSDLDDGQLKALLDDIDHMQAVPITDPEPVTLKIGARSPLPGRGT